MKRLIVLMLVLMSALPATVCAGEKTRIMFVMHTDRVKETMEQDAELAANIIQRAGYSDHVEGITLDGGQVFDINIKERNPLRVRKRKAAALHRLKEFYLDMLNSQQEGGKADVAGGLRRGMERFNAETKHERYIIVLFSSGLQNTASIDLRNGCYPSDTWVTHPYSPQTRQGMTWRLYSSRKPVTLPTRSTRSGSRGSIPCCFTERKLNWSDSQTTTRRWLKSSCGEQGRRSLFPRWSTPTTAGS